MTNQVAPIEVLLVSQKQASQILGVSQKTIYNLDQAGALSSTKIGGRRLYHTDELKKLAIHGVEVVTAAARVSEAQRAIEQHTKV